MVMYIVLKNKSLYSRDGSWQGPSSFGHRVASHVDVFKVKLETGLWWCLTNQVWVL